MLQSWLGTILHSGAFIALCAVAFAWETSRIASVAPQPFRFYAFLLLATWASYRLHALRPRPNISRLTATTTWIIVVGGTLLAPTLPSEMWPTVAVLIVLAWAYSRRMLPGVRRLREYGLAKILILAGVWTIATTYLPLVDRPISAGPLALLLLRRFLFMFTLCVAFDLRDRVSDTDAGIRTLPVRLGVRRSFTLMRITLLAFVALVLAGPALSDTGFGPIEVALLLSAAVTSTVIEATSRGRSTAYYLGLIDGMMLVQAALVWVMLWTSGR